jgi:maltodextrin utilization protein YvdJ
MFVYPSSFSHPNKRFLLEKLMGSNIVRLTDREFMQKLQERICEDHLQTQSKRIQKREVLSCLLFHHSMDWGSYPACVAYLS